nr:immunoglobulin heavy chain junction region [Macaca mulatta]
CAKGGRTSTTWGEFFELW